jgi:hypothetical protein
LERRNERSRRLEYAVKRKLLGTSLVKSVKWKPPKAAQEVDRRCVLNPAQARRLLSAVRGQSLSGPRLVAFFAVIYYAGLRPEAGAEWTDDGQWREHRHLKSRPVGEWYRVPELPVSQQVQRVGRQRL